MARDKYLFDPVWTETSITHMGFVNLRNMCKLQFVVKTQVQLMFVWNTRTKAVFSYSLRHIHQHGRHFGIENVMAFSKCLTF